MSRYLLNLLIGLDQLVNVMLGGAPDITISSRCWQHRDHWAAAIAVRFIDSVFKLFGEKDHCKNADEGNEADYEVWG